MCRCKAGYAIAALLLAAIILATAGSDDDGPAGPGGKLDRLGADWPTWRGPRGDGSAPGVTPAEHWPKELKRWWKIDCGEGYGAPAVAGKRLVFLDQAGEDEVVRCIDIESGREQWRHAYRARYSLRIAGSGPRSSPAIDGDRVYTVGATGRMHCLALGDGEVLWARSFAKDFGFRTPTYGLSASPLVDGDRVIVHTGAGDGRSILALDKRDGSVKWQSQSDPAGYASPMIVAASKTRGPRQLIQFTEKGLVSLNPADGSLNWRYPWTTSYEQNIAQPVLAGDLLVISTLTGVAALRLGVKDGRNAQNEAWRSRALLCHFSCPVAYRGAVYGVHGRSPVLRCIDATSGAVKWSQRLSGARGRAGMVRIDAKLLIYTDTGELVVAAADEKAYREIARYELAGRNWCPPVVAHGLLFVRDNGSLQCYELPLDRAAGTQADPAP